jgi:hypothetical protein
LKAAGVSDLSQHIEGIDPVDDGRAKSGLTQPQTVFQSTFSRKALARNSVITKG